MIRTKNDQKESSALSKNVGLYKSPMEMKHWEKSLIQRGFSVFFLQLIHSRLLDEFSASTLENIAGENPPLEKPAGEKTTPENAERENPPSENISVALWLKKWQKHAESDIFVNFQNHCVIFTSQRAVDFFFHCAQKMGQKVDFLSTFSFLSLGRKVSEALRRHGMVSIVEAENPSQEGVWEQVKKIHRDHSQTLFFYFSSTQARSFLVDRMQAKKIAYHHVPFYQTDVLLWQKEQWKSFQRLDFMVLGSTSAVNALKKNFFLQITSEEHNVFRRHPLYLLLGRASEESFVAFQELWRQKTGQKLEYSVLKKPSVESLLEMFG